MNSSRINDLQLHNQGISSELEDAFRRVLDSGWFALGPEVEAFEREFADWCGVPHCRGVGNGTDALELALRALGVEPGAEVVVAANCGMYSTTAILAIGARPVYADIDPSSHCIDPVAVDGLIGPATRAIVATHLYGRLCDMAALRDLADRHGVALLEDCAQAHGARENGARPGSWGDAAAFSFYPTKNLGALGDGGAIVTCSPSVSEAVTQLRQYGWGGKYTVVRRGGRNSRLDELQAAFLRVKLGHVDAWTDRRREIARAYAATLRHELVEVAPHEVERHAYHLYVVRSPERDGLLAYLRSRGVGVDVHYPVLDCRQPVFADDPVAGTRLPHSERAAREVLTLPCYPELGLDAVRSVAEVVNGWVTARAARS
jgi:dTDP-4-amino-4,6-dideoxygalactose transaminase